MSSPTGFITFIGTDQFGNPTSTTLAIDQNGQNQYNFTTADGEFVTQMVISVAGTDFLEVIKQVSLNATQVSEPRMLSAFGAGLAAAVALRRRKKKAA